MTKTARTALAPRLPGGALMAVSVLGSTLFVAAAFQVLADESTRVGAGATSETAVAGEGAEVTAEAEFNEAKGYVLYRRGLYEQALDHWEKAASQGDAGAAFRLGEEYFDAKVVERDVERAVGYFMQGAEGGDERAQMDLATMYDHGWGVEKDPEQAARWYLKAAEQGMPEAQYNIGTMYQTGVGVDQDIKKAYMFFLLAVQNGFTHFAATELEKISQTMSNDEIKQATLMARSFEAEEQSTE